MYELDKYTVSLLHFDDGIKDETGKVWTAQNGASISTSKSKVGGSSLYLDGKNQYLTTPHNADFDFGNGDFTIDWWEYRTVSIENAGVFFRSPVSGSFALDAGYSNGTDLVFYLSSNGTTWNIASGITMGKIILNEWVHYALVRSGTSIMAFQNGVLKSKTTISLSIFSAETNSYIGYIPNSSASFSGYIDEFRISNIARWTEDFDPEPIETTALLRVTMLDSSERDYQLSTTEIDGFISWYMKHTSTDTTGYMLTKKVGTEISKEYLTLDKIISFEVLER